MKLFVLHVLAAALALPAAASITQETAPPAALERSPKEWPTAPPGRWDGWDVDVAPPKSTEPLLLRAIDAFTRNDMPATLQALFELLEQEPDFPSALHQAGVIYFRLRRYEDSIVAFERYLVIAPHRTGDTRYLAHSYYSLGRYEKARDHYKKVLAVRPKSPEAHHGLGLTYMRLGRATAALAELQRVLELDPKHADAAAWIAQILYDEERLEDALVAVEAAQALDAFSARTWFLTSQIHYELGADEAGDAAKARFDLLDRATQELRSIETQLLYDPTNGALFRRLVALHREVGNERGVKRGLQRWLQAVPDEAEARTLLERLRVSKR